MELITQRLRLREFVQDDIPVLRKINLRPEVRRFEDHPPLDEYHFQQVILGLIQEQTEIPRSSYYFAILRLEDEAFIGSCYVCIRETDHRQAEIGYILDPDHWNQGYATEAAQASIGFGFDTLNMHRIYAGVLLENTASMRVLERVCMRREAVLRHNRWFQGRWWDSCIYALLEDEWRET